VIRPTRLAGLAAAALLTGCAVGPRYAAPVLPPAARGPFVSANAAIAADAALPPLWWRLYQDPVLDRLVARALTENQDLKVAAGNLAYAQGLLEEARAGRFPGTTLTAAGPTYGRSAAQALSGASASTGYAAAFTASYQIDLFGRIRRAIEAARANAEAVEAAEDVTRVTIAGQTAGAYANICGYGEQLDVARRSLALVQETYKLTAAQRDAGALSDFEVDREGVLLAQARAAIAPLEGQRRAALFSLAALIGVTPSQVPPEADACRTPPSLTRPLPVGDGAALLRRRPDLREAERQLAAATARIGVATADLYPTISLGGSVAAAASASGRAGGASGATYSVGPGLTWTVPNILVARARIHQAGGLASAALASFDGVVLRALKEAEGALSAYAAELDHHAALVEARRSADDALRLANIQLQAGSLSSLDLITTEQTAVAADQALAQSDQAVSADQVAVFQALGGGWEDAPVVRPTKLGGS
jgi:NodT family efflux transporter outer membrane factor (OMF) lipoprotein